MSQNDLMYQFFIGADRFGKTTLSINWLIKEALTCQKPLPRVAYIAPFRQQAKVIAWSTMIKRYAVGIPGVKFNEAELSVTFPNGAMLYILGADNPDSCRGAYWDAVVIDEYAQIKDNLWGEVLRPALTDRKGKAIFIGTPMGRNAFYDLYVKAQQLDNWYAKVYTVNETEILDEEELKATYNEIGKERYAQEFLCSWSAAIQGAYYSDILTDEYYDERLVDVPYNPLYPVQTAWDLGYNDATAIWFFQTLPTGAINIIDFEWDINKSLEYWIDIVVNKQYRYSKHIGPHDLNNHEFSTGMTRLNFAKERGIWFKTAPNIKVVDGINAVRQLLPLCYFDRGKCFRGIEALKYYRKEYNKRLGVYNDKPLHDPCSDPADAFRYLALGYDEHLPARRKKVSDMQVKWSY